MDKLGTCGISYEMRGDFTSVVSAFYVTRKPAKWLEPQVWVSVVAKYPCLIFASGTLISLAI